ncbi:MAG: glycosyltransferase [Chloroflexi bacterium]|uniref:Glycosyltransferase n=1 Tax=Candidatus Chlorohelix allophototropha TaxID=3003348 RepID=A0A8T7LZ60_9CHLR|nr:glycosyltransferase [Chloroflexota bacterium]WJW67465.1 glycosyltransferase [Chloroflexota bacterium L227-S17]
MSRKILILTPQNPFPPDQGAPIRNYNFIKYLGATGKYNIALLTFARPEETSQSREASYIELSKYCERVEFVAHPPTRSKSRRVQSLALNPLPDLALRLASPQFQEMLNHLVIEFKPDILLCEALELAPFVRELFKNSETSHPKLVLDEHNAEYLLQKRAYESDFKTGLRHYPTALYSYIQTQRLSKYESEALHFFDAAIAVSDNDRKALLKLNPNTHIKVIPNGIDLDEYAPDRADAELPDRLVFTGSMDFRPNVDAVLWFANEIWDKIRLARPEATFFIVGRRPTPAVQALAKLPGITVTGTVPDARPFVQEAALYLVPMRMGGGVRFKVLEALAMGKAVLTTPMGADGIPVNSGKEVLIANNSQEFSAAAIRLLQNPTLRKELADNGRTFVAEHFDWHKITPLLDEILCSR